MIDETPGHEPLNSDDRGQWSSTILEIEQLSSEEFDALPRRVKRRYFAHMDRENGPTARELHGEDGDNTMDFDGVFPE